MKVKRERVQYAMVICFNNIEIVQLLKIMMGGGERDKHMQKSFYVFSVIILVVMALVLLF